MVMQIISILSCGRDDQLDLNALNLRIKICSRIQMT